MRVFEWIDLRHVVPVLLVPLDHAEQIVVLWYFDTSCTTCKLSLLKSETRVESWLEYRSEFG